MVPYTNAEQRSDFFYFIFKVTAILFKMVTSVVYKRKGCSYQNLILQMRERVEYFQYIDYYLAAF